MCFHYSLTQAVTAIEQQLDMEPSPPLPPVYHADAFVFPEQPVVLRAEGLHTRLIRWGLIPHWVKSREEADTLRTDPATFDGRVDLGVWVTVELPDGQTETVRIVHPEEAFLDDERVSATSPMAIALLGARAGHTVWVAAPKGTWRCRVVGVHVTSPAVLV